MGSEMCIRDSSIVEQHVDGTMTYVLVDRFCVSGPFEDFNATEGDVGFEDAGWTGLNVQDGSMFRVGMRLSLISDENLNLLQDENGTASDV